MPYFPLENVISKEFESTILWSVGKGFLNYNGKKLYFHTIDRTIMLLMNAIMKNQGKLSVIYPIPKFNLLAPMCLDALYFLMNEKQRNKVLLITENIGVRTDYKGLFAGDMNICTQIFPIALVRRSGELRTLFPTKFRGKRWKGKVEKEPTLVVTRSISFLPKKSEAEKIGLLIFEVAKDTLIESIQYVLQWAESNGIKSVVFVDTNPYSERIGFYSNKEIPIWGWSDSMLKLDFAGDLEDLEKHKEAYSNPFSSDIFQIKNFIEGIERKYVEPQDEKLNAMLKEARDLYVYFKKWQMELKLPALQQALAAYLSTIYSFERMLAPIDIVNIECSSAWMVKTTESRINILRKISDLLHQDDPLLGGVWSKTVTMSEKIFDYMKANLGCGKAMTAMALTDQFLQSGKKVAVVNVNEAYNRAFLDFLEAKRKSGVSEGKVFAASLNDPRICDGFDVCIFFGALPFRARYLFRAAAAPQVIFLTYPSEKNFLIKQIEIDGNFMNNLFNYKTRIKSLSKILNKSVHKMGEYLQRTKDESLIQEIQRMKIGEPEAEPEPELEPLSKIDKVIEEEYFDENDEPYLEMIQEERMAGKIINVKCIEIKFTDGYTLYTKPKKRLPVFVGEKNDVKYIRAENTGVNDVLVVVNKGLKESIAQSVINVVDSHHSMKETVQLVKSWVVSLRKGMVENGDSAEKLLEKMMSKGSDITTSFTIKLWEHGFMIGPRSKKNLLLIGKIYNDKFLLENIDNIYAAVRRLRGIHRSLLSKLGRIVPEAGLAAMKKIDYESDVIDEELDLYLEDFMNIVSLHKINSIKPSETNITNFSTSESKKLPILSKF